MDYAIQSICEDPRRDCCTTSDFCQKIASQLEIAGLLEDSLYATNSGEGMICGTVSFITMLVYISSESHMLALYISTVPIWH